MKLFKRKPKKLSELATNRGGCIATNRIVKDYHKICYMYRDEPNNKLDNGWRFFAGDESEEYLNNPSNSNVYDTNTIANIEPAILSYLDLPIGTQLERLPNSNKFIEVD